MNNLCIHGERNPRPVISGAGGRLVRDRLAADPEGLFAIPHLYQVANITYLAVWLTPTLTVLPLHKLPFEPTSAVVFPPMAAFHDSRLHRRWKRPAHPEDAQCWAQLYPEPTMIPRGHFPFITKNKYLWIGKGICGVTPFPGVLLTSPLTQEPQ